MTRGNGPQQEYPVLENYSQRKILLPPRHLEGRSRNPSLSIRERPSTEKRATQRPIERWLDPSIFQ